MTEPIPNEDLIVEFLVCLENHGNDPNAPAVAEYLRRHPFLREAMHQVQGFERRALAAERPESAYLQAGDRLNDFLIQGRVNQGGMGVIYEAVQESLGRSVALKTIKPSRASAEARVRFERERRTLARIHETHIVPVLASGSEGDLDYFAMPYIRGRSLRELLRDRRRGLSTPPTNVLDLLTAPEIGQRGESVSASRLPASYYRSAVTLLLRMADALHRVHGLDHRLRTVQRPGRRGFAQPRHSRNVAIHRPRGHAGLHGPRARGWPDRDASDGRLGTGRSVAGTDDAQHV